MLVADQRAPGGGPPITAKRLIERLAKRKTVEVSTLVRLWVIEGMRREARRPWVPLLP